MTQRPPPPPPLQRPDLLVAYIAGPYRAPTVAGIAANIAHARQVAEQLTAEQIGVMCPHLNTGLMDGLAPDAHFLALGLELLRRCDAVVTVPGWQHSSGTLAELAEAEMLGIPVYDTPLAAIMALTTPES